MDILIARSAVLKWMVNKMTNEELCEIMDNSNFLADSSNKYDMKILEILNKQVPKSPHVRITLLTKSYRCPVCNCEVANQCKEDKYCDGCGQAIDWSE